MWPVRLSSYHHAACLVPHLPCMMNSIPRNPSPNKLFYERPWSWCFMLYHLRTVSSCYCLEFWTQNQPQLALERPNRLCGPPRPSEGGSYEPAQPYKAVPTAQTAHKKQRARPPWSIWDSWSPFRSTVPGHGEESIQSLAGGNKYKPNHDFHTSGISDLQWLHL